MGSHRLVPLAAERPCLCRSGRRLMTPLRIRNHHRNFLRAAFSALMIMLLSILVAILAMDLLAGDRPFSEILLSLPKSVFIIGALLLVGILILLASGGVGIPGSRATSFWVEIGDALTYCDRTGSHVLGWGKVKQIEFDYSQWYSDPDEEVFSTLLVVTDFEDKTLSLAINSGCAASECAAEIVETLVQGLRNPNARTRLLAAEGLGRLGPGGIQKLKDATEHEATCVQNDATETLRRIKGALSHLQGATKDKDEGVRIAAAEALDESQEIDRFLSSNRCRHLPGIARSG